MTFLLFTLGLFTVLGVSAFALIWWGLKHPYGGKHDD